MANENKQQPSGKPAMVYVIADGLSTVGKDKHLNEKTVVTADDFFKQRDFDELVARGVIVQKAATAVEDKKPETKTDGGGQA